MGSNLDMNLRLRILEFVGYGKGFKTTEEIFEFLGWNIDSRKTCSQWYQLISNDRKKFHKLELDKGLDQLIEGDRQYVYKRCLENWYLANRLLLYKHPEGWETPLTIEIKEKLEQYELMVQIEGALNKTKKMRRFQEIIPYNDETLKALENQHEIFKEELREEEENNEQE